MRFWFDKFKGQRKGGFLEEIHSSTTHVQVSVPSEYSCLVKCLHLYLYRTLHVNILFYCGELTRQDCRSDTRRLLWSEKCIYSLFAIHLGFLFHVCSSVLQPENNLFLFLESLAFLWKRFPYHQKGYIFCQKILEIGTCLPLLSKICFSAQPMTMKTLVQSVLCETLIG